MKAQKLANLLGSTKILSLIMKSADLLLAVFIMLIMMMIVIPVSTTMIDNFIAINLTFSIAILMVALYISKAVQLSIFPSLLLITTLFRLGIEISATRQILLHADAGHIIHAFGEFVVGGNFVIGIIIFLIITIVQFIVVTKGAERVAEVAARFTLDAMPGKQMSIDADMRSGVIDANQARSLRLALQKESQLYGAMDGAMKFVKGDVIAAIVIAVINIVGGLIVGIFFHGMTAMEAAQVYTLLSIGGGLISQIPSLLISLTAGIVTTRVSSDKKDANLGREIGEQLLGQPKATIIASAVIFLLGFVSGFPMWTFFILALAILGVGLYNKRKQDKAEQAGGGTIDIDGNLVIDSDADEYRMTIPIILELGEAVSKLVKKSTKGKEPAFLDEMIPKLRRALYAELGVRFPGVQIVTNSKTIEANEYIIKINEQAIATGRIPNNQVLTNATLDKLKLLNITSTYNEKPVADSYLWVDMRDIATLNKAGIKSWQPLEVVLLHLSEILKKNAKEFLGIQEVRGILSFLEKSYGDLAKEVTRLIPLQRMTDIFKRLVEEQISILDLRTIMEALATSAQSEKDTVLLTEYTRQALRRYIMAKYSQGTGTIPVYKMDPNIENQIRNAIKQTTAGSYLQLDNATSMQIIEAAKRTVNTPKAPHLNKIFLVAPDIRRYCLKLLDKDIPNLVVLSTMEVENVSILGYVTLNRG